MSCFLDESSADSRRKIWLHEWAQRHAGNALKIDEGKDKKFRRKIVVQVEGKNELINKRKKDDDDNKMAESVLTKILNKTHNKLNMDCKNTSKIKSVMICKKLINRYIKLPRDDEVEILKSNYKK